MSDYPEHDKLTQVKDETQAAGEFIDWLQGKGIFLARYVEHLNFPRRVEQPLTALLAEWTGIDQNRLEAEKRQMLAKIRAQNEAGQ